MKHELSTEDYIKFLQLQNKQLSEQFADVDKDGKRIILQATYCAACMQDLKAIEERRRPNYFRSMIEGLKIAIGAVIFIIVLILALCYLYLHLKG